MKHYASWSPIQAPAPAFHLPEFFGEIQFWTTLNYTEL
jgi:hypothetical protein